ncbi:ABC transporter permease subunit [Clostridiaceae bacterium 35-E11]
MGKKAVGLILFVLLMAIIFIGVLPLILLILLSFSEGWRWPEIYPHAFGLRAWKYILLSTSGTLTAIKLSLQIALLTMIMNLLLAVPAADALGRYDFKGKKIIEAILFMPIIVPPIIIMMGMYKMFIRLNLTESITGVVIAHIIPTLPYMIRSVTISFGNLGFQWEEQAKMLGASKFTRFIHVIFPFLLPGMITGGSLTVLISFSQYIITVLIGGGKVATLPVRMFPFINGGDTGIGAAYALIFAMMAVITLFVMDLFLKRYYEDKKIH